MAKGKSFSDNYKKLLIILIILSAFGLVLLRLYMVNSPELSILQIDFSNDSNELTGAYTSYVWDCSTGKVVDDFAEFSNKAEFSPDGRYLLITLDLRLYDRNLKKIVFRHKSSDAVFSVDGKSIIFVDDSDRDNLLLSAIDTEKHYSKGSMPIQKLQPEPYYEKYRIVAFRTISDDILAALYKEDLNYRAYAGSIEIFNITTGKILKKIDLPVRIKKVVFNGNQLVVAGKTGVENRIIRIDTSDYSYESSVLGFSGDIESLSDDGRLVVYSFLENGKIYFGIYDISAKRVISKVLLWSDFISGVSISPDGQKFALGSMNHDGINGELRLFDVQTGNCIKKLGAPLKLKETFDKLQDPDYIGIFLKKLFTGRR